MSPESRQAAYFKKKESVSVSFKWVNWALPAIVVCAILFYAEDYLANPMTLPVNKIRVHGAFDNVNEKMLHRAVANSVAGGYFNVDVENVREVVENLPWVSEASVRRVWPDTLSVSIVEQKPIAVSKSLGLINSDGEVFKPEQKITTASLPVFDGSKHLNKLMLVKYHQMNVLLEPINRHITYLKFDARHALELSLDNGLKLVLGRGNTAQRLERFIRVYPKVLSSRVNDIDTIDLRYTNGMAISWKKMNKKNKGMLGDAKHV